MSDLLQDRVFAALADSRRRGILEKLASDGEKTATELGARVTDYPPRCYQTLKYFDRC